MTIYVLERNTDFSNSIFPYTIGFTTSLTAEGAIVVVVISHFFRTQVSTLRPVPQLFTFVPCNMIGTSFHIHR